MKTRRVGCLHLHAGKPGTSYTEENFGKKSLRRQTHHCAVREREEESERIGKLRKREEEETTYDLAFQ